ncbi:hypothetical protein RFI_04817 [Reticulomyxa filosa]|uniref:Uncharacterized protein n=1 Tax=Reticulomyxa filosa TaxID=46433 RepID=X6P257_RETFI|nr:hypothetical protein RFI_04817 [Reticulomyxa filosa]|eukprot:ETO32301.1 hypothetical protein RFI_04817 [Reticulomyxa filosa]
MHTKIKTRKNSCKFTLFFKKRKQDKTEKNKKRLKLKKIIKKKYELILTSVFSLNISNSLSIKFEVIKDNMNGLKNDINEQVDFVIEPNDSLKVIIIIMQFFLEKIADEWQEHKFNELQTQVDQSANNAIQRADLALMISNIISHFGEKFASKLWILVIKMIHNFRYDLAA